MSRKFVQVTALLAMLLVLVVGCTEDGGGSSILDASVRVVNLSPSLTKTYDVYLGTEKFLSDLEYEDFNSYRGVEPGRLPAEGYRGWRIIRSVRTEYLT